MQSQQPSEGHKTKTSFLPSVWDLICIPLLFLFTFLMTDAILVQFSYGTGVYELFTRHIANMVFPKTPLDISKLSFPTYSALLLTHLSALIVALGSAFFVAVFLIRNLAHKTISKSTLEVLHLGSTISAAGLTALWLTGFALLVYYALIMPELLNNPKIWGKFFIVTMLTINAMLIRNHAIPSLEYMRGARILDRPLSEIAIKHIPLVSVSTASWVSALFLSSFDQLNNTISATSIIAGYFLTIALTYVVLVAVCANLKKNMSYRALAKANWAQI